MTYTGPIVLALLAFGSALLLQEPEREVVVLPWSGSAVLEGVEVEEGVELFVSASADDFDPELVVLSSDARELARDRDGGDGTTAFVRLVAERDDAWIVEVLGEPEDASGTVRVELVRARGLDDELRELLELARAGMGAVAEHEGAGDLDAARAELRGVLELLIGWHPDDGVPAEPLATDSADLSAALWEAGVAARRLRDHAAARVAWGAVWRFRRAVLPEAHTDLQRARMGYSNTLGESKELRAACALQQRVVDAFERTRPEHDFELLAARQNLGATLISLGKLDAAARVLERARRTLARPGGARDPRLSTLLGVLASLEAKRGDRAAAIVLYRASIEAARATQPETSAPLLSPHLNLAQQLRVVGELQEAREILDRLFFVHSPLLLPTHPQLINLRDSSAVLSKAEGDYELARSIQEENLQRLAAELPSDHPRVLGATSNLAVTLRELGELDASRALMERVFDARSRLLEPDDPKLLATWIDYGVALEDAEDLRGALALYERALVRLEARLEEDDPSLVNARCNVATARARLGDEEGAVEQAVAVARTLRRSLLRQALFLAPRRLEDRVIAARGYLDLPLALAARAEDPDLRARLVSEVWSAVEELRGAALLSARLLRALPKDPELEELRAQLREAGEELADAVRRGLDTDEVARARARRDGVQEALLAAAAERSGELGALDLRRLAPTDALVGYTTCASLRLHGSEDGDGRARMLAFVRPPGDAVELVVLDAVEEVAAAAQRWRDQLQAASARSRGVGLGVPAPDDPSDAGAELRRRVLDPVRGRLEGVERVRVAAEGALHLIPLDALPLEDGLVGDHYDLRRHITFRELSGVAGGIEGPGTLLVLGGIDYASPLGGGTFEPLPATALEAEAIAATFERVGGEVHSYGGEQATRAALVEGARGAAWLHLATHGWFAGASAAPVSPGAIRRGSELERQVLGSSPMVLCGLALAGANRPADERGRRPGAITAEELATLDLSACRLAVLSACETGLGVGRAGQGLASLQKALHLAGARRVVTSLWRVPDEATRALMTEFYRLLWVEGAPAPRALWAAKRHLREARDERGALRYSPRDWGGWILTGAPD